MIAGLLLFALKWISVSGCGMCAGIGPLCFQKIPPMGFSPLCGAWGLVSLGVQGCLSVSSFVLLLPCWALVRWVPPPPPLSVRGCAGVVCASSPVVVLQNGKKIWGLTLAFLFSPHLLKEQFLKQIRLFVCAGLAFVGVLFSFTFVLKPQKVACKNCWAMCFLVCFLCPSLAF